MLALALKDIYCHPAQLEPECGLDVQSVERKARTNYGKQLNSVICELSVCFLKTVCSRPKDP